MLGTGDPQRRRIIAAIWYLLAEAAVVGDSHITDQASASGLSLDLCGHREMSSSSNWKIRKGFLEEVVFGLLFED